jgi:ribosomal-protein-alanine N-acetyltransferase
MTIRLVKEVDFPKMLELEELTSLAPWSEAAFRRCWEANYPGWVLEDNNEAIGFLLLSLGAGECHILNFCVHPTHQKKGNGFKLLTFALGWAKQQGAGIVFLEVRRSNIPAIALYRNMNFKLIGERKNYYPTQKGSEDALVFARDLGLEEFGP